MTERKIPVYEHLFEVKRRVLHLLILYIALFIISYYFKNEIYDFIVEPLTATSHKKIIYTGIAEAFFSYIDMCISVSLIAVSPCVLWHIYRFVAPGLYREEKRLAFALVISSGVLFYLAIIFVYYLVIPKAWSFFLDFETSNSQYDIIFEAKISEYISIVTSIVMAFAVAFQLPIVIIITIMMNVTSTDLLIRYRRFAIVCIFIIAGIITPPDVISQLALAIPMVLFYECTILIGKKIELRRTQSARY
jgi:sec-independent protein translocase protein TatC